MNIIFDMDGLLLDTERVAFRVFNEVIGQQGLKVDLDSYVEFSGLRKQDFIKAVERKLDALENVKEVINRFYKEFEKELYESTPEVKKGSIELITYLKENDISIAIATSTHKVQAHHLLRKTNLLKYFEVVVTGDMIDEGKPSPDIFLETFKQLNIDGQNAMILEDSINGIKAAYASGAIPILIPDLKVPTEEVKRFANKVFPSLEEFLIDLKKR